MSIRNKARARGALRDPSLKVGDVGDPAVHVLIDVGQNPEWVGLHDLGTHKRRCTAGENRDKACALCDAEVPVRVNWTMRADLINEKGEMSPRTLWCNTMDLGRLGGVIPDFGTVQLAVDRVVDEDSTTTRDDGEKWTIYRFAIVHDTDGGESGSGSDGKA
jgi:hypothetical protein